MISIDDKYPLVSIVIPTLNRKVDIVECLGSIQNLDYPKNKIELIVWDNGSIDGTPESIKSRDWTFSLLDNLMVERFKPVLFTSNKDSKGLANLYGDHVLEFLNTGKVNEIFLDSGANRRNKFNWSNSLEETREGEIIVEW